MCSHIFLHTAYAVDSIFFLKYEISVLKSKCEVAGKVVNKRVQMALCGMECINLTSDSIKPLGVPFSYNKGTKQFKNIFKIENVLKLWRIRILQLKKNSLFLSY